MRLRYHPVLYPVVLLAGISLLVSGCGQTSGDDTAEDTPLSLALSFNEPILVGDLEDNAADAFLQTSPEGEVLLSWTETDPGEESHNNRNAFVARVTRDGQQLGEPRQMNNHPISGNGGENLAKFTIGTDGSVAAVWPVVGPVNHTGDLKVAYAEREGAFSPAIPLNDDQEVAKHGYTGIATAPDGKVYAAWLDGREEVVEGSEVYMAVSQDGGKTYGNNYSVSPAACNCCRPSMVFLEGGETIVLTYRIIEEGNVRNHVALRSTDGGKTFGDLVRISDDGWVSHGCPHAGISIVADSNDGLHAVWWTGGRSEEEAGIYYTYSGDGGKSFAPRQLISEAPPYIVMHAQVTVDKDDNIYATWVNVKDEKPHIFFAHRRAVEEEWSEIYPVSDSTWHNFFPVVTVDEQNVYVAWTERKEEGSRVKLRTAPLLGS